MPTYSYVCEKCEIFFHQTRPMSEPHPEQCPDCGEEFGEGFHVNFRDSIPNMSGFASEPKKGESIYDHLPEGCYRTERPEKSKEIPWFRAGEVNGLEKMEKPLDVSKIKDTKKYILTGEKD